MVKIINGEVVMNHLPRRGRLQDGRSVSNYHLLEPEVLATEGWLPVVDEPPQHDRGTEMLVRVGFDVRDEEVHVVYQVQSISD